MDAHEKDAALQAAGLRVLAVCVGRRPWLVSSEWQHAIFTHVLHAMLAHPKALHVQMQGLNVLNVTPQTAAVDALSAELLLTITSALTLLTEATPPQMHIVGRTIHHIELVFVTRVADSPVLLALVRSVLRVATYIRAGADANDAAIAARDAIALLSSLVAHGRGDAVIESGCFDAALAGSAYSVDMLVPPCLARRRLRRFSQTP